MNKETFKIPVQVLGDEKNETIDVEYVDDIESPSGTGVFLCWQGPDDTPFLIMTCIQAEQLARALGIMVSLDMRRDIADLQQENNALRVALERSGSAVH